MSELKASDIRPIWLGPQPKIYFWADVTLKPSKPAKRKPKKGGRPGKKC